MSEPIYLVSPDGTRAVQMHPSNRTRAEFIRKVREEWGEDPIVVRGQSNAQRIVRTPGPPAEPS